MSRHRQIIRRRSIKVKQEENNEFICRSSWCEIGEGVPKICVPIVGKTKEEILAAAKSFADVKMDVVEWRVDWFDGVFDFAQVEDVLKDLRPALGNTPILFTFRTSKEGGEKAIEPDVYVELNKKQQQPDWLT